MPTDRDAREDDVSMTRCSLTVCVPCYGKPPSIVSQSVHSAASSLPDGSELLVLPDGPAAASDLQQMALPAAARMIGSEQRLGLVGNWNRCLRLAQGDLIHILHDDDAVAPGFYAAILELRRRFPDAAMYGTGARSLEDVKRATAPAGPATAILLEGDHAAAFILEHGKYSVGGIVLSRRIVEDKGLFRKDFPHFPDEEAYLRYASGGGLAFDPAALYLERTHGEQARRTIWRRPGFATSYVRSRVEGASAFSPEVINLARKSSAKLVISVVVSLALDGEADLALGALDELGATLPECRRWPRFWLAWTAGKSRLCRKVAGLRRKYRAGS